MIYFSDFASVQIDPLAWTELTFSGTSTRYGMTVYEAAENFAGAEGDLIEIEAYVYASDTSSATVGVGNQTEALYASAQADGNFVQYRYISGAATSVGAVGTDTDNDYSGIYRINIMVTLSKNSNNTCHICSDINHTPLDRDDFGGMNTNFNGDTLYPFITTDNLSVCSARYRVL